MSASASKALKLTETYERFWRANTLDALYTSSGALAVATMNSQDDKFIRQEIDVVANQTWNKPIELGLGSKGREKFGGRRFIAFDSPFGAAPITHESFSVILEI